MAIPERNLYKGQPIFEVAPASETTGAELLVGSAAAPTS